MARVVRGGALWTIVLGMLIGVGTVGAAASNGESPPRLELVPRAVDASDHPTVHLHAELRGVTPDDDVEVVVVENGDERAGATATWLADDDGHPHDVVLVIDTSGSMRGAGIAGARQAALALLERLPHPTRVAVVEFATEARVVTPLSTARSEARAAIEGLAAAGRTSLHDGVQLALDLLDDERGPHDGHATIVLLADGEDNASRHDEAETLARVTGSGVTIHAIELRTPASDLATLERFAAASDGGTAVTAMSPDDLAGVFGALDVAGASVLRISYTSEAHGHVTLAVTVTTSDASIRYEPWRVALPPVGHEPSATTAVPSGARPVEVEAPGRWMLLGGWMLVVAALFALVAAAVPATPRVEPGRRGLGHGSRISGAVDRAIGAAQHSLERGGRFAGLADALGRAGIAMSPGRYLVNVGAWIALAGLGGFVVHGIVSAVVASLLAVFVARAVLTMRQDRRRVAFADQLDDTLLLLAGSLRAGHSLLQSIDTVAREAQAPTSEEFRRIVNATRLGQDLTEAFRDVVARTASQDLDWVAQAIAIHREVGGNLASVLDAVAATIRERNQIRRQVRALSAEGRLSAIVLISLPVALLAFLAFTNPAHVAAFTTSLLGMILLAVAVALLIVGGLWLRQIVKVRF